MHFDEQAIGARGDTRSGHRHHLVAAARCVRRVHDDRKVREFLDDRDRRDIQRVARVRFESPDASLAENDFVVSSLKMRY